MHSNALICLGKSIKKKERVPDGPTIKYSQGIKHSYNDLSGVPCLVTNTQLDNYNYSAIHHMLS